MDSDVVTNQAGKLTRLKLIEKLSDLGKKAYNPEASLQSREKAKAELATLLKKVKPLRLITALTTMVKTEHEPPWLRSELKKTLAMIPLRPDGGVRASLEFVFATHPSGLARVPEAAEPQKRGGYITQESLQTASRIIAHRHAAVSAESWYSSITPQLFHLLEGHEGPELMKTAAYIIGFGILGRRAAGAPGTPGWKYFAESLLSHIAPNSTTAATDLQCVHLNIETVLVSHEQLALALHRLSSLLIAHPNPGLCRRLLSPILLPLWAIATWPFANEHAFQKYCRPACELLKIFLRVRLSTTILLQLIHHVLFLGGEGWIYNKNEAGELEIVLLQHPYHCTNEAEFDMEYVEFKMAKLCDLLGATATDDDLSTIFLQLLRRRFKSEKRQENGKVLIRDPTDESHPHTFFELLATAAMRDKFPLDKLTSQPILVFELLKDVLDQPEIDDDSEEIMAITISLMSIVITAPGFCKASIASDILESIMASLEKLSRQGRPISCRAGDLLLLLQCPDDRSDPSMIPDAPVDSMEHDRNTYNLALTWITDPDSPPPVQAEGLDLLSRLIISHSPVLDIPAVLFFLCGLMGDCEDYINQHIIRMFTLLASRYPQSVVQELVDRYLDSHELADVDTRLRYGEALVQVIERLGATFTGELAVQVGEALLFLAGRRGHRPRTEERQAREELKRQMENKEAAEAWGGECLELSDPPTEAEKARLDILARIVNGWHSRRGSEDVRIRASALSVLGSAIETSISGLGPTLVTSAAEVCKSVLELEKEVEKGILRRAAVSLISSFSRSIEKATQGKQLLGCGIVGHNEIMAVLQYVAATDDDGLVRQHAQDCLATVAERQATMISAMPVIPVHESLGLERLAGLSVSPEQSGSRTGQRPKIEEMD